MSGAATELLETRTDSRVNSTIRAGGSAHVAANGSLDSTGTVSAGYSGTIPNRVAFGPSLPSVAPVVFDASLASGPGIGSAATPDRQGNGSAQFSAPKEAATTAVVDVRPGSDIVSRTRAALLSGVTATGLALFPAAATASADTETVLSTAISLGGAKGPDYTWTGSVRAASLTSAQVPITTTGTASDPARFTRDDLSGDSAPFTFLSATSGFDRASILGGTTTTSAAGLDKIFADQAANREARSDQSAALSAIAAYRDQGYFTATNAAATQSRTVILSLSGDAVTLSQGTVSSAGSVAISATTLKASGLQGSAKAVSVSTAKGDLSLSTFSDVTTASMALQAKGGDVLIDTSRDFSGDFTAIAGKDIRQTGTSLSAQNIVYTAANDIVISAAVSTETSDILGTQTSRNTRWSRGDDPADRYISQTIVLGSKTVETATAASLKASGTLQIVAGNDVGMTGVSLAGGTGALIVAGRDLNLLPETLTSTSAQKQGKTSSSSTEVTNLLSSVTSGGDLTLAAGYVIGKDGVLAAKSGKAKSAADLTVSGAHLSAEGTLKLSSEGKVIVAAATDIVTTQSQSRKSSAIGLKKTTKITSSTDITHTGATLSGKDVTISGTDIILAGSDIDASQNITLNATGTILSGAYADVHDSYSHKSSSWLGGLVQSFSTESLHRTDLTGSDLLADADLSLITDQGDIALQGGSYIASGGTLTIKPGSGKLILSTLIDTDQGFRQSQSDNGVTRTLTTESWNRESASYVTLHGAKTDVSGVKTLDTSSLRAGTAADGSVTLTSSNGTAGSAADVGAWIDTLPKDLQGKAAALAIQGLANGYSYDKQTSMNPAFKALVAVAVSTAIGPGGWLNFNLTGWQAAAASSAIVNTADAALTGNFDLGDIARDAAFAAAVAKFQDIARGYIKETSSSIGSSAYYEGNLIPGLGNYQFSITNLAIDATDAVISSGMSSAVYGTDFWDGVVRNFSASTVDDVVAALDTEIGDLFTDADGKPINGGEGSIGHVALHSVLGCVTSVANGSDCVPGAAGAGVAAIYSGSLDGSNLSAAQQQSNATGIGALTGYLLSGGDAQNVSGAANAARSVVSNNRQLHTQEAAWIRKNAAKLAAQLGISEPQAQYLLTAELLRRVSDDYSGVSENPAVSAFVDANAPVGKEFDGQHLFAVLNRGSQEYQNSWQNIQYVRANADIYASQIPTFTGFTPSVDYPDESVDWLYYAAALDSYHMGEGWSWTGSASDAAALAVEFPRAIGAASANDAAALNLWSDISAFTGVATSFVAASQAQPLIAERLSQLSDQELGEFLVGRGTAILNLAEGIAGESSQSAKLATLDDIGTAFRKNFLSGTASATNKAVSVDPSRATRGTPEYELLNNPPANTRVELSNGTTFRTGEGGYVDEITYQPVNSAGVRDGRQTAVGREGIAGDVGGHIQACRHGGTCDRFNLFPQNSNFNNSAYRRWENEITSSLQNGDDVGNVTVRLNRADPYNPRPDSLEIEYQINGRTFTRDFENQAGGGQ